MLTDEYIKRVYGRVVARDGDQPEFLQAVREVFETLQPVVEKHAGVREGRCTGAHRRAGAHHHVPRGRGLTTRARFR